MHGRNNCGPHENKSVGGERGGDSEPATSNHVENNCQMQVDNSQDILKTIQALYHDQQMCDVFLTVGKKEHPAHRLILCAFSDVFQAMLMKPEWTEWHESRIVLQEPPQCEEVFDGFLEYLYTGRILITHTNVMAILTLADKYIVKSLTQLCIKYMSKHVAHAAYHNQLFLWLQYTANCGYKAVAQQCFNFIKWNFQSVANTPDFSNFGVELLCDLLQQNDLIVYNEMVLYNCVVRWLDLQHNQLCSRKVADDTNQQYMERIVRAVMKFIRFPMMTPRELADLLLSPLMRRYRDILLDRMTIGMIYQSGKRDEIEQYCTNENGALFLPRLYTCDSFNTTLMIENVPNLPPYHVSPFVFSTHMSLAEHESEKISEWVVDLYPKGVWFKKCFFIGWQGTIEVPEHVKSTVRLSLTCRTATKESLKVNIGILLYGTQSGCEHIMSVVKKVHYFDHQDCIMVIDDLIPFQEFNNTLSDFGMSVRDSQYYVGSTNNLKIGIIITPHST